MNHQQFRSAYSQARQRMAAFDPNFKLNESILLGSLGTVSAVSLADLVLGNTNAFNSGELSLNSLYQLAPLLAAYGGARYGGMTYDEAAAVKQANDFYEAEVKAAKEGLRGREYNTADERIKAQTEFANRKNKAAQYRDNTTAQIPGLPITGGRFRRGLRGAAIGAAAGSVPAILGMIDSGD